jgi:hypothetical protein
MAYAFNGTNQYLRTASCPVSAIPITIACNTRGNATGVLYPYVVVSDGANNSRLNVVLTADGIFVNNHIDASNAVNGSFVAGAYSPSTWIHLCGVFTSVSSRSLYVNGSLVNTNTGIAGSSNSYTRITIGANHTQTSFAAAQIAEVGIWNAALTADEIASLAKGMTCDKVRPQSLVFYTPLVRNLQDVKGGLTITNNNTATVAAHPRVYS